MGAVYLVKDSRLGGKNCALKEMSDATITDSVELMQAKEAFHREAEMLSGLSHAVLPRVTDFFSLVNKHYLVMDFADGRPLDEILEKRTRPFPVSMVLRWADQLCDVLVYLHSQKPPVIYRDLKPGNIMLAPDRMRLKLIDFGIARTYKLQQTKDTIAMGTPGYSPPEQYGKGQTDQRSDIYALGATLHHLLTLRDPGDDPFRFPQVKSLNSRVSDKVNQVIMKAVEQERENRWQCIEEMAAALEPEATSSKIDRLTSQLPHLPPENLPIAPSTPINIPSTPISSLAASFLSQNKTVQPTASALPGDKMRKILDRIKNYLNFLAVPKFPRHNIWRDYSWVAFFCIVAVLISFYLEQNSRIESWGYWGEILGSILLPLPFLFSAVFVKRIGAAGLPVLIAGFYNSGVGFAPLMVALAVELPFFVVGYKHYHYPLLFLATLMYGLGEYLQSYRGDVFFALEEIITTWMVAFLGPIIVFTINRITNQISL